MVYQGVVSEDHNTPSFNCKICTTRIKSRSRFLECSACEKITHKACFWKKKHRANTFRCIRCTVKDEVVEEKAIQEEEKNPFDENDFNINSEARWL